MDSTISIASAAHSGPPMLRSRPLIGMWPEMRRDTLGLLARAAELGDIGGFQLGPRTAAVVSAPEPIHDILIGHPQDFEKGRFLLRVLRPVLGDGLLVSEGDLHTRQRRLIAPTLGARRIRRYVDWIVQEADRTVRTWADGSSIEVLGEVNALAMNIIGRILFGTTMRDESRLAEAVTTAFEWEMNALTSPLVMPPAVPTPGNRRMRAARGYVRTRIQQLIDERRGDDDSLLARLATATYPDGTRMSSDQLLDETLTLWGAAHETSADAQAWTIYLLAKHPDVLAKVTAEVDDVLGDRDLGFEDLAKLPLSLQVFKEALRLYPPAAAMVRVARHDTIIGSCRVRAGTILFICPYTLHRNPAVFPDPEIFRPDRFSPEREPELPKQGFLPFGTGGYGCVGNHLALMEGQALTATLAQRIRFHLPPATAAVPELLVNLRPAAPLTARISHRRRPPPPCDEQAPRQRSY